jgi:hypothetical protein
MVEYPNSEPAPQTTKPTKPKRKPFGRKQVIGIVAIAGVVALATLGWLGPWDKPRMSEATWAWFVGVMVLGGLFYLLGFPAYVQVIAEKAAARLGQ